MTFNFKKLAIAYVVMEMFFTPGIGLEQSHAQGAPTYYGNNLLINPWMEIDQVNEGASTTISASAAGTFTYQKNFDGWQNTMATSASSITGAFQNAALHPNGSASDLLVTVGTGSATHADGTLLTIEQRVEPIRIAALQYGTANAQSTNLQFCAKASIAGNYGFYIAGGTAARTSDIAAGTSGSAYFHQFNIPTAGQVSCYNFLIPGDTGGTWLATTNTVDATHGATLGFVLGINGVTTTKYGVPTSTLADGVWQNLSSGANVIGSNANYVAMDKTTGSTFELSGVKWSMDSAPLAHNPELELLQAQRYFSKTFNAGVGGVSGVKPVQNAGVTAAKGYASGGYMQVINVATGIYWPFPVQMAKAPTITTFSPTAGTSACGDVTSGAAYGAATVESGITGNATALAGVSITCAAGTAALGDRIGIGIQADARE